MLTRKMGEPFFGEEVPHQHGAGTSPSGEAQPEPGPHCERRPAFCILRRVFVEALLEKSPTRPPRRSLDWLVSLAVHTAILATIILVPLYFTEALDLKQFTHTVLVAPPPPVPPPPPPPISKAAASVTRASAPKPVFALARKLVAPTTISPKIPLFKEEQGASEQGSPSVADGVPGGVPGGQPGGAIGGILSSAAQPSVPPPPPPVPPRAPIRVGGNVKAPRAISTLEPVYPALAKQARIQGEVVINAVIDTRGNVVEMQAVSGSPLLITAAMEALRQWKYEPTYLNGEPVAVQLLVTINFRLN